ncbi:MAG: ABC transporter ATP-binding protein [Eubacteriales bacterium]
MATLELRDLSFRADKTDIVKNVSFSVDDGELFVLCGPSGAGKTTILRLITGEWQPQSGDILLDGRSLLALPMQKRETILVPQGNNLFPHMTIFENAAFALKARRVPRAGIRARVDELALRFRLEKHMNRYPHELSGGQQKLAAILRAVAVEPQVLLLDEPFNGLDNHLHGEIRDFLLDFQKERHLTVLMISHSKEDAFFMGNHIGFLFDGHLRMCADVRDLYKKTGDNMIDSFLGEIVTLPDGRHVFADKILQT